MSKAKVTSEQGGAQAPPTAGAVAIVITATRTLDRYLPPGTIIPHPTERELKLCGEGAAESLEQWWPGLLADEPEQVDGKRYPMLLTRPGGELWVRLDARTLRPLNDCSVNEAIAAIGRCADADAVGQASEHARHASVRQAAKSLGARPSLGAISSPAVQMAATEGRPPRGYVALGFSGGRWPTVLLDNGKEVKPADLYQADLLPMIASCEHEGVLKSLARTDAREAVKAAAAARLKELAAGTESRPTTEAG